MQIGSFRSAVTPRYDVLDDTFERALLSAVVSSYETSITLWHSVSQVRALVCRSSFQWNFSALQAGLFRMSSSCVVWHYLHFYGFLEELVRCIAVLGFVLSQFQYLFLLCHTWLLVLLQYSLNRFDLTRMIRFQVAIQYSRYDQCAYSPYTLSFTNIS